MSFGAHQNKIEMNTNGQTVCLLRLLPPCDVVISQAWLFGLRGTWGGKISLERTVIVDSVPGQDLH